MKQIKVLECCMRAFGYGGAEVMVWNWYQNFDYKKIKTDFVINLNNDEKMDRQFEMVINRNGGRLYKIISNNKIIQQLKRFHFLHKLAKNNQYDCIHIHASNAFTAFIYYSAVNKYCKKVIIHSHNSDIDGKFSKIKQLLHKQFRVFIKGENVIRVACSTLAAKWMYPPKFYLNKNYIVIKNGIETKKFIYNPEIRHKLRKKLGIEDKFVIGHVGRFAHQKNHNFLIDVFNIVYRNNSDTVLLLIGSGDLENEIKDKIHKLGLEKAVIFYGQTENVSSLYQVMDYFVFPSFYEGLPITLIEAQASGLKILCSDSITSECKISSLMEFISLSEPPQNWAHYINKNKNYRRTDMSIEIKENGFDIMESSSQLLSLYLKE